MKKQIVFVQAIAKKKKEKQKSWLPVLLCFFCIIVFNRWFAINTAFTSARLYNLAGLEFFVCFSFFLGVHHSHFKSLCVLLSWCFESQLILVSYAIGIVFTICA